MNHGGLWSLLLIVASVSGCSAPNPVAEPDQPSVPSSEFASHYELTDCMTRAGEFRVDADSVSSNVAPGFTVVRDETGLRAILTVTALFCAEDTFDATLAVVPPSEFLNDTVDSYRMSEGGFVDGRLLLEHYAKAGLTPAYAAAAIELAEDTIGDSFAQGQVVAETNVTTLTLDWTGSTNSEILPATVIRTFVQDNEPEPPVLLGYCDEHWPGRTSSKLGVAVLGNGIPLTPVFVPPGNMLAYGPSDVVLTCHGLPS